MAQQPPNGPRDAKAELKASKAYSKAQRPWYKKKRWILSLGFILLIAAVSAGSGGGGNSGGGGTSNDGGTSASNDGGSGGGSGGGDSGDDGKSGSVGQAVENAGTTYKVTNATQASQIGDPELGGARADGTFVIVNLELTNNKDETKTFTESSAKVVTSDGNSYKTSDKTVLAFSDDSLLLKDIQPDLTARGKLAFDLPPSKVSGSVPIQGVRVRRAAVRGRVGR